MPAITIPREEIQPRPQVIKLTFIIQLHEIYLINDNRQSEHAESDLKEKKTEEERDRPSGFDSTNGGLEAEGCGQVKQEFT